MLSIPTLVVWLDRTSFQALHAHKSVIIFGLKKRCAKVVISYQALLGLSFSEASHPPSTFNK
jgi:hypothetical protein